MECLSPIEIITPTKFISPCFGDVYVRKVPCGKCAACQDKLNKEWYFRAFYEYQATVENNGYMLMDCLTYSEKYVPRVSRYIPGLPRELNFRCFDYTDLRYFLVRLRWYLSNQGYDVRNTLRYFAATEYGTTKGKTHRPHIHLLFYVTTPGLDNITLSKAISSCWKYGRTDGIPYKSKSYVDSYTIKGGLASSQRACKYVSKYVMKDSEFQKVVNNRLSAIMHYMYENRFFARYRYGEWCFDSIDYEYRRPVEIKDYDSYESFLKSEFAKKQLRDLKRHLNQFHRQSLGFGASALRDFDINEIMQTNIISIPDGKKIVSRIGLPTYYKRKLFYELLDVDGTKIWQLTELGKQYKEKRIADYLKSLSEEYSLMERNFGYKVYTPSLLADYVVNKRGRLSALFDGDSTIQDRLNSPCLLYNYVTSSDKSFFHKPFLSFEYKGYSNNYQNLDVPFFMIDVNSFIKENVIFIPELESILSDIQEKKRNLNAARQRLHDNRQRLNRIFKEIYSP